MPDISVNTVVNGQSVRATMNSRAVLADLLRDRLGLTGTKVSCGVQVCGACTVLMDGAPVSSCSVLAADADRAEVTTVEGLAGPAGLHPLQQAFIDHWALQCGFCTPGFIVSVTTFLRDHSNPTDAEIHEALSGNLCRCTGYQGILRAVRQAAGADPAGAC